ncbi:energy transducer TonB [Ekhidna sp.]|uniref:energy transducer TonB n=1 Tax=Ekhidna sp. TaxID=2608089 RepID=UPI003C7CD793
MSKDKNHSEQFERYLKGQMSPKEAHAFEREILDDPFAQEALEGMESQDPEVIFSDLKYLKKHISKKKNSRTVWLRAAAMIAMLVVGSIAVFYLFTDVEQSQLASGEEAALPLDSTSLEIEDLKEETIAEVTNEVKPDFDTDGLKVEDEDAEIVENYLAENESTAPEEDPSISADAELALSKTENIEITPRLERKRETIQMAETDALDQVVTEPSADEMIVLEEAVPAQAFVAKKKMAVKENEVGGAVARSVARSGGEINNEAYTPPRPLIGDSLYQQYLREEQNYPETAKQNKIEGEVILKLAINEEGQITDIKVDKSLGYGCDLEAIRLVEEGPEWNAAVANEIQISDTVRVSVQFKLPR